MAKSIAQISACKEGLWWLPQTEKSALSQGNFGTVQDQKGEQQSSHRPAEPARAVIRVILHREQRSSQAQIWSGQATTCCIICNLNGSDTTLNTSSLCCRLPGVSFGPLYQHLEHCHYMQTCSYFASAISFCDFMTNSWYLLFSFWFPEGPIF